MAAPADLTSARAVLERTYAAFNARDVDAVLAVMHPEVDWPNGMEGGRVRGHAAVRAYWTRQWTLIDPRVEPRVFTVYTIRDGLITAMEIRPGPA
ncbi:MAG TPA: nuclear transport factor 2 family protein [Methylomirabilota bacterium]|nr:nuclear transport factor 2 family protein [Methylomirabilota bacterium]